MMNSTTRKVFFLIMITLLIGLSSTQGGFFRTGSEFSIKSDDTSTFLNGKLLKMNRRINTASINLDNYLGNLDGSLDWESREFTDSCKECKLVLSKLSCNCLRLDSTYLTSEIDLNDRISNSDGFFKVDFVMTLSLTDKTKGYREKDTMIATSYLLNSRGTFTKQEIDLNLFISNYNGFLIWRGSEFSTSCGECNLRSNVLSCKCLDLKGNKRDSSINLNGRIINDDGKFKVLNIQTTEKDTNVISESTILQARQNLKQGVVLSDFTSSLEGEWRGFNAAQNASIAASTIKYIASNRRSNDFFPFDSTIKIQNNSGSQIKFVSSHSYQMQFWDKQFSDVNDGEEKSFKVRTARLGLFSNWRDTNAEGYFRIECNGKPLSFSVRVRNFINLTIEWEGSDAYNDCYDIQLTGSYAGSARGLSIKGSIDIPVLVTGTFAIPNYYSTLNLNVIPHQPGTRYPTIYEHCNYQGISIPLLQNQITGQSFMFTGFNDKISSIRVPPGIRVALFEHDNFNGKKIEITEDIPCLINFNDITSSYVVKMGPIR